MVKKGGEKIEDTKEVIRSHKSKGRQYNGQKRKRKDTNNGPQDTTFLIDYSGKWLLLRKQGYTVC